MELLQRIPKEHYTTHEGKQIKVGELLAILNEKNTSNYNYMRIVFGGSKSRMKAKDS